MTHPITPPPELFAEWLAEAKRLHPAESTGFIAGEVARLAYRTGADQELEACCKWLRSKDVLEPAIDALRTDRRPKPPSLKEQALEDLASIEANCGHLTRPETLLQSKRAATIRRALEALPDD